MAYLHLSKEKKELKMQGIDKADLSGHEYISCGQTDDYLLPYHLVVTYNNAGDYHLILACLPWNLV